MKNVIFIAISFILLSVSSTYGQDYMKLLNDQDYESIGQYANDKVNLEIDRKKSLESAAGAIKALRTKLNAFKPTKWSSVHNGTSEENDAKYFIAEVYNSAGDGLRIFFHLEAVGDTKKVSSIRIRDLLK